MKTYLQMLLLVIGCYTAACQKDKPAPLVPPVGPPAVFRNPIVTAKFTADPAALVHNGTVYLYAGHDEAAVGQNQYVMNEWLCYSSTDMATWTEHPVPLRVTDFSWARADAWASQVIERNGKFYWYATEFPERIAYAMSRSPEGPWVYKGILNELAANCNTNHQAIIDFKGKWYFVYHNGNAGPTGGSFRRSACVDYLNYNADSTLVKVTMTAKGVDPAP